jgi:hypothetical protein
MVCKGFCNKLWLSNNFGSDFEMGTFLLQQKYISKSALAASSNYNYNNMIIVIII